MANDSVESRLKKIDRWNFVPGKNRILPVIEKLLAGDEIIITAIDGFFNGTSVSGSGDTGALLVTDRRIILIPSAAPERFISLKKNSRLNISFIKNFSTITIRIESGGSLYSFTTDQSVSELAKGLEVMNLPVLSEAHAPVPGNPGTVILQDVTSAQDRIMNLTGSGLPVSEIKKITDKLEEIKKNIPGKNLISLLKNDILTLTAFCDKYSSNTSQDVNSLTRAVLSALHDQYAGSADPENIVSSINTVKNKSGKTLAAFQYIKNHDKDNNTNYADKLYSLYYEYSGCLIKSGTMNTDEGGKLLKEISAFIREWKDSAEPAPASEPDVTETIEQVMDKINSLVGMQNIKDEIRSFINYINIMKERQKMELPATPLSLHAVFYGPPGTGKTTIARLLGRVYKVLGLLTSGHLVETDRSGLVAGYVGQTAIKTDELVNKAKGGILFIDEAYTLIPENSTNDFGKEAVDTILKRMEDMRENFAVIAAGYTDEMERFIKSNPGLKSRFSRYYYFDHYSPDELVRIFHIFSDNVEFKLSEDASAKLKNLITHFYALREKSFGNARFVRNVFDKTVQNQADRLASFTPLTSELLCGIEKEDIPEIQDLSPEQFS